MKTTGISFSLSLTFKYILMYVPCIVEQKGLEQLIDVFKADNDIIVIINDHNYCKWYTPLMAASHDNYSRWQIQ